MTVLQIQTVQHQKFKCLHSPSESEHKDQKAEREYENVPDTICKAPTEFMCLHSLLSQNIKSQKYSEVMIGELRSCVKVKVDVPGSHP